MSGNILIVDGLATNRIVLKVKLSAAYFRVSQAATASEALQRIRQEPPQAVLMADDLPDATAASLITDIRALPGCDRLSILVLSSSASPEARLDLLALGARDVMTKPFDEKVLLARLRSLSRQAPVEADLGLHVGTAEALGFAEAQTAFARRGRIAALAPATPRLQALMHTLGRKGPHRVEQFHLGRSGGLTGLTADPDVLLVGLPGTVSDADLSLLAELISAPQTRAARCLVLLDAPEQGLAATVLDVGAHDMAATDADPREIALRLDALVHAKQAEDMKKARLRTGLHAAVTDPLTGLYNRRYALAQMARMTDAAGTTEDSFAVLVADLDHFKTVNDTYGHGVGDKVLVDVAHALRDALRPGDVLSRIGGEEFLILLPRLGKHDVHKRAETLCKAVRAVTVLPQGADRPLSLTISIGATIVDPVKRDCIPTPEMLLAEADRALYAAKSDGRNTVTFSALSAA